MGRNVLHGLTCREICCSEYPTDIGEKWQKDNKNTLYKNDQLPNVIEQWFEIVLQLISFFHLFIAVGILLFGLYTYFLREEIHSEDLTTQSELIRQMGLVPIYLIVVGCVVIVVSIIGTAGVMRHNLPLLFIYASSLFTYSLAQLVCAILALTMKDRISDSIYKFFSTESIISYRDDPDLENIMSKNSTLIFF